MADLALEASLRPTRPAEPASIRFLLTSPCAAEPRPPHRAHGAPRHGGRDLRRRDPHRGRPPAQHRRQHDGGLHPPRRRHARRAAGHAYQHHGCAADRGADRADLRRRHARPAVEPQRHPPHRPAARVSHRGVGIWPGGRAGRHHRLRSRARPHRPAVARLCASTGRCAPATSSSAAAARSRWARRSSSSAGR